MNHVQTADRNERNSEEAPRHDWSRAEAQALYDLPFADLIFRAQSIHRSHFDPNRDRDSRACSASRPAAVRRIAATVRRARIMTPA